VFSSEVRASWYDGIVKSVKSELEYSAATTKELPILLLAAVGIIGGEARLGSALTAHNPNVKAVVAAMLMGVLFADCSCSLTPLLSAVDGTARCKEVFGAE